MMTDAKTTLINMPATGHDGKPRRIDQRKRPKKSKTERLAHAPGRSDRQAVITCQTYLAEQGSPITAATPLAEGWREILPLIHPDRQQASQLVIGILIAEGISPADLTMARIEALVTMVEHRHRATHLVGPLALQAEHLVQRSLRSVFAQCVAGLILARSDNPGLPHFGDLGVLASSFAIQRQSHHGITASTKALIDGIFRSDYAKKLASRSRKRYRQRLLDCAVTLEAHDHQISAVDDFWSRASLDILCSVWQKAATPEQRCFETLHVLRWIAKHEAMDLAAIAAIKNLAALYRAQQPGHPGPRDLSLIAKYGADTAFCCLLADLLGRAGGEGPLVQPRQQIARASGACLCLIQLMSGVRLPQLDELMIIYDPKDGQPSIVPVMASGLADHTRTLPIMLQIDEVKIALEAYCDLFLRVYGRRPTSLLDGLVGVRDHKGSAQARMSLILGELAPGMTPGMLRDLLAWRLATTHAPTKISRILGYKWLTRFEERYRPLFALAASQDVVR